MASLLPYTKVQRADGGFDFFNPTGQKTTIENYTAGTGVNGQQLRQSMAQAGDQQSIGIVNHDPSPVSGVNMGQWNKYTPQVRSNLINTQTQTAKLNGNIWNPGAVANDIANGTANLARSMGAGMQQGIGTLGDVAAQGGGLLTKLGIQSNPLINNTTRNAQLAKFDNNLANGGGAQALRSAIHNIADINGSKIVGTSNVDQNAANIAAGKGNFQDYAAVAGKGLEAGNAATMFMNPVALARSEAGAIIPSQVIKSIGSNMALFGGLQGLGTGLSTYGQTGDLGQAIKEGAQAGLTTGLTAGVLNTAGALMPHTIKTGKAVASAVKDSIPTADSIARQNPQLTQLVDHATMLQQNGARLRAQGFSENHPALIQNTNALKDIGQQYNTIYKQSLGAANKQLQGGYIKVPFNKDQTALPLDNTPQVGKTPITSKVKTGKPSIRDTNPTLPEQKVLDGQSMPIGKKIGQQPLEQRMVQATGTQSEKMGVNQVMQEGGLSRSNQSPLGQSVQKDLRNKLQKSSIPSYSADKSVSLPNNTPDVQTPQLSTADYIKQQYKAQELARKQGTNTIGVKVKNEISTKLIDSLSPIEAPLKKAIKNGADVPLSNHITPQLDRALRADTIAGQYIKDNGLAKVIQNVPDTKAFDQYLIAKHAADLKKQGIKTGRNLAADKQLVDSLKATYEPHAQAIRDYSNKLLDKTASYGLISKDLAASLKKQYPNYVPANRIFGDGELTTFKGNSGGKASLATQSVVQRIKGSTRAIESPLASLAAKTQDVISQGERNKAGAMLASYKDLPGNPFDLRPMKSTEVVGAKSTISYLENGKLKRFETTPEIATAAKSLNKEQIGILGKIVRIPTRMLRLGATGVNAGFAMANIAKDLVSAAINSEHMFRSSAFNPGVLKKATAAALYHGGKSYGELVREGAGGTSFDIARNAPRETVKTIRANKNVGTKVLYNVTHPVELLRAVENTIGRSEEFTRAMQYYGNKEAGLAKGLSGADATTYGANAARNNTVNFARAGDYGAVLNSALPYLNAGVQGSRTFLRNVKNRPVQTLTKVAVLSTLPALTTTAWNLADPNRAAAYNDISEYEKQGNLIIVPPNPVKDPKTGRWNVIKIPVSQEIANLNNIARNAIETAHGDNTLNLPTVLGDLIGTATSLNAQTPRQVAGQITPQALKPVVEGITNQNLFTGNQIVPDSQKNLPAQDQYGQYTSGTAKVLGGLIGQSPRQIDNFVKTAFGGAGQTAVNVSDNILATTGAISPTEVQGKSLQDSVTNRFIGATSKSASDYAATQFDKAKSQLIATPEYKALPQSEQAKALNRLQTDVNAIQYNKSDIANPNPAYPAKKLTANQTALDNGTKSITSYTVSPANTPSTAGDPKATYQKHLDAYNTATKDGTLSGAKAFSTQQSLAKEAVTSQYPQAVLDFYGMSKAQQNAYFAQDRTTATSLYDQAKKLDAQLVDKGMATSKYKTGLTGTTSKVKTGKVASAKGASTINSAIAYTNKIRAPKFSKVKTGSPTYKKATYKTFAIKTPKMSKVKTGKAVA